ncbi:MAG: hypothetical protein K0S71_2338 [Clostridia bacterium]|jgi:hypothetical protein|nr:hypothetical protein [Clostridia bacterium]
MISQDGYYVIEDYDKKSPFASFLSGIAGVNGKPIWSFFVNRGQGISSFGNRDKDGSIMEFFPASEAYKYIYTNGFRTFIKINEDKVYEPFAVCEDPQIQRAMKMKNNELRLEETNHSLGLWVGVTYYILPNEDFGALARRVDIKNLADGERTLEVLDGMPAIFPYGVQLGAFKSMANLLRSWMQGDIIKHGTAIYKQRASSEDTTKVEAVEGVHYYTSFDENNTKLELMIDPQSIFGYDTSYAKPVCFLGNDMSKTAATLKTCYNKVPAAFSLKTKNLKSQEQVTIYSYIGYAESIEQINVSDSKICTKEYFEKQLKVSNALVDEVTKHVETKTAYPLWDAYVKQTYVDNVLRGGYPIQIGQGSKQTYYIYSRKHGDLEREYNFFSLEPNYYSQGNANFRDVSQNRRLDTYLNPQVKDENVKLFYNLLQIDGYNPLVISGNKFIVSDKKALKEILRNFSEEDQVVFETFLKNEFTVGTLCHTLKHQATSMSFSIDEMIGYIIDRCETRVQATFGEGFWIDHWTYNLDMVEQFLEIYPDEREKFLIGQKNYRYFNSPEYVLPRSEKYVLENGKVRQYTCIKKKEDKGLGDWLQTTGGEVYTINLMGKLISLAVIKFATLDPYGIGIEMEAGKPGWNDSMNGLPGILGSSTAEMFELKRLIRFIKQNIDVVHSSINMPIEFKDMIEGLENNLQCFFKEEISDICYWDAISTLRESFREQTKYTIQENEYSLEISDLSKLVDAMLQKIESGIDMLKSLKEDIVPTFLYYEVDEYTLIEERSGREIVSPKHFKVHLLPDFLEGPVRYLKTESSLEKKETLYKHIKASKIYDEKLKMYKVSAPIDDIGFEIGRSRVFTPGWLERESIFMHMSFKYLLELIKNNLYEVFFEDMKHALPAFMNPEVYGRSLLENSSFIASSVNPDPLLHGKGFVARLSGTTVELLNMWKIMMVGHKLFSYEQDKLTFQLQPILTKDFFDKNNEVQTVLLGSIQLTYKNENRRDTFGKDNGKVIAMNLQYKNGERVKVQGNIIKGEDAKAIRDLAISKIVAIIE